MVLYRSFQNFDPPAIASVWESQKSQRLARSVSADLLEQIVFSKPYFDPEGLIVAEEVASGEGKTPGEAKISRKRPEIRLAGFIHAGFSPAKAVGEMTNDPGIISLLMVRPIEGREKIAQELRERAEDYLRRRGAKRIVAGEGAPEAPFYWGLIGGSEPIGIEESDPLASEWIGGGYSPAERRIVLERQLNGFRPPVDRRMIQIKRQVELVFDPPETDPHWGRICREGILPCGRLVLTEKARPVAEVSWRRLVPEFGLPPAGAGIHELRVVEEKRRQGLGLFLIAELLKRLQQERVAWVETQTAETNRPYLALLEKLAFRNSGAGIIYSRNVS